MKKIAAWSAAVALALLAWGGSSIVGLLQRVSAVETEQRGTIRWMERIDERLDRVDAKLERLLRR